MKAYDYSQAGAYFVTICTHERLCLFGDDIDGAARTNSRGEIVADAWRGLPRHYPHVVLGAFVLMPNHVHGIVLLTDDLGGAKGVGLKPAPTKRRHALSEIVRAFKTFSARRVNALASQRGAPLWQRNYYEHVIRDEQDLSRIREYITSNPLRWAEDPENPAARDWVGAGLKPTKATGVG